jgi:hypothetical protein
MPARRAITDDLLLVIDRDVMICRPFVAQYRSNRYRFAACGEALSPLRILEGRERKSSIRPMRGATTSSFIFILLYMAILSDLPRY